MSEPPGLYCAANETINSGNDVPIDTIVNPAIKGEIPIIQETFKDPFTKEFAPK